MSTTTAQDFSPKSTFREDLARSLKSAILEITFIKKDGTERVMQATLRPDLVPVYEKKTDRVREVNESILPVYDIEAEGWRSINLDSIELIKVKN